MLQAIAAPTVILEISEIRARLEKRHSTGAKEEARALKAAEGMRLMINDGIARREPVLFCGLLDCGLLDRFLLDQKQEQEAE